MSSNFSRFFIKANLLALALVILLTAGVESFSQDYEFTLEQRRRYDQIHVEIWGRAITADAPTLGFASLIVKYNTDYLVPASIQNPAATDSINRNIDQSNPIDNILSQFNSANGYRALNNQAYGQQHYGLEITLSQLGIGGIAPQQEGKGSFLGKMVFDIIGSPGFDDSTAIEWSKDAIPGDIQVFDADSNSIEENITFIDPDNFDIIGITIISPNLESQVIDRDQDYSSLINEYSDGGYPIYFERSVNPSAYSAPIDEDLAFRFEYSLDDGNIWTEFGRIAETSQSSSSVGDDPFYVSGEIFNPDDGSAYTITSQDGSQLDEINYRNPVRVVWSKDEFFIFRSEQARLRINWLAGTTTTELAARQNAGVMDMNDSRLVLGRLFFLQLNGTDQYLQTKDNYSNATQLTVEAWVNLNEIKEFPVDPDEDDEENAEVELVETGIVASSGGPDAFPTLGSNEGAWMLYLHEGKFPAFRVREISGRGENGYIGTLIAFPKDSLTVEDDSEPLTVAHAGNWVHLAGTVNNNIISLYVNGELAQRYVNNDATDIRMLTTNHPIWIGVNPNSAIEEQDYLRGGIKGVKIWRNALTQEEIRQNAAGVPNPADVGINDDLRKGLELFLTFEGSLSDLASDSTYQNGFDMINYFVGESESNNSVQYRPDRPHITLTSPIQGSGITNNLGDIHPIRWLYYGYGDVNTPETNPVNIEYTIDAGQTWYPVRNPDGTDQVLANSPAIELLQIDWEPWENNISQANLRTIEPYNRLTWIRVTDAILSDADALTDIAGPFQVAPYFSIQSLENSIIELPGDQAMNITGNEIFIETWIKPYRFPTPAEEYFSIVEKIDSSNYEFQYGLRLLPDGELQFVATDSDGVLRTATSDSRNPLVRPNSIAIDTAWTHVGVYLNLNNNLGATEIRFFIDGVPQRADSITTQFGDNLTLNSISQYPVLIGYRPGFTGTKQIREKVFNEETGQNEFAINDVDIDLAPLGFQGEMRELRFWTGTPNETSPLGSEPTELTTFIQGAQAVRAEELTPMNNENLFAAFSFNGGNFQANEFFNAIGSETNPDITARFYNGHVEYFPVEPYIKLVEPTFMERVANTNDSVRVRWVGFEYDNIGFRQGDNDETPSLEFSIRGGGGDMIQPYQYVGSEFWSGNDDNSISFPNDNLFRFVGTGSDVIYALNLNASIADPDENNDGTTNDQAPLSASLTNARFRLTAEYTVNSQLSNVFSEGPLFTVTPASNFTVRVLLEGYHDGNSAGSQIRNLGQSFDEGGLRITLYRDNSGGLGELAGTAESNQGYDDRDPDNRDDNNNRFANANFVFTDLTDGNYWVVVEHPNHLPIMSRFAAPFQFIGDDRLTWQIESGWDFQTWNGEDNNVLTGRTEDPYPNELYTAAGDAIATSTNVAYSTTGLIYNNGVAGGDDNALAAMVGGDIDRSGQIDAADRVRVRLDVGTSLVRSDVTGDGIVNADDRTITDRNFGKVSSIYDVNFPNQVERISSNSNPLEAISPDDPELSSFFIENEINKKYKKQIDNNDIIQAGIKYDVLAEPEIINNQVKLRFYIQNTGGEFGLANATFAVQYNADNLSYGGYSQEDTVIFSNRPEIGYVAAYSGPRDGANNVVPDVRTVEIDYDANAMLDGETVPTDKTYLGTLTFNISDLEGRVAFDWHYGTSVHSIDGRLITEYGTFHDIEGSLLYEATITHPNGGERIAQDKPYTIRWVADGDAPIFVEFSTDGGILWNKINQEPIQLENEEIQWQTPISASTVCLVRLVDAENGEEIDRSDAMFSIQASFAQMIRPAPGDPVYRGGTNENIWWFAQGYNKVRFEFSPDAGQNWQEIPGTADATAGEMGWKIPKVTTKLAIVRIIDLESGEEIARSGAFRILDGQLVLQNPRFGERLFIDKTTRIRWTSQGVAEFDLQLSRNGGSSWEVVEDEISGLSTYMNWKVTGPNSNLCIMRAIWNGDPEMEYDRTDTFIIDGVSSVNELPLGSYIGNVYPNPAENAANINFKLPQSMQLSVKIVNSYGETLAQSEKVFGAGDNYFEIETGKIPAGLYFIVIEGKGLRAVRRLAVVH